MNHSRSPWTTVRHVLAARRKSSLCRIVLAPWLAFTVALPGAASAQVTTVQAPHGLSGSAAWREHIRLGVDLQLEAIERADRALLLARCSAWNARFPKQQSPATLTAINEFFRWMTGEAYTDLPQEPYWAAMRDVLPILARHMFSAEELATWDTFRESPEGRRAEAMQEITWALAKVSRKLKDDRYGQYWGWPLARLVRLADAHGFGAELDAAFDKTIGDGTAAKLRSISLVPGETPADERMLAQVPQSAKRLIETFIEQLPLADLKAHQRFVKLGMHDRWGDATHALHQLAARPTAPVPGLKIAAAAAKAPKTLAQFCKRFARSPCPSGGELDTAVSNYRTALVDSAHEWATLNASLQIVRGLPSSGCRAPE